MTPTKIMPGDQAHTPLEKAQNWASETHHGKAHQNRWNRVAATMGADNGCDPYTFDEVKKIWQQFGKNARWTVAVDWFDSGDEDVRGMVEYHFSPAMQGNYSAADFEKLWNQKPVIVQVKGWGKAIIDPKVGEPTYWLDGEGAATETWERVGDEWRKVGAVDQAIGKPFTVIKDVPLPVPGYVEDKGPGYESDTNRLAESVIAKLPVMTEAEANEFYAQYKGDTIEWVAQREPSVGPHSVVVLFHNGVPVRRKASNYQNFTHLPFWTKAQAETHFIDVEKVGSYSRRSLDGHWNTVKGYCKPGTVEPLALAATQLIEDTADNFNHAMTANDWVEVARLAKWLEMNIKDAKEVNPNV